MKRRLDCPLRLDEVAALTDHRKARAEYARAAGTLLADRNVVLPAEAPAGAAGGSR